MTERICSKCESNLPIENFYPRVAKCKKCYGITQRTSEKRAEYLKNNKDKIKAKRKDWILKNIELIRKKDKDSRNRNPNHKQRASNYRKRLIQNNPSFKLAATIRTAIYYKLKGEAKPEKMEVLLGCSIQDLKLHLESKFKPGMTWENHGKYGWHIDHIIPCSAYDLTKEENRKTCFHYSNLQPLWAKENLSKSKKLPLK